MSVVIETVYDQKRLCGWRHESGLYLTASGLWRDCGKLPLKLDTCQVCGGGIKVTRGLQRINVRHLFENVLCNKGSECGRLACLINAIEWGYLMGVGEKFYKTRDAFLREALEQGVSKRIAQIPRDFKVGESAVLLAHPKVFRDLTPQVAKDVSFDEDDDTLPNLDFESETTGKLVVRDIPGVIAIFRPERIEYITKGDETEDFLQRLVDRGITPVKVVRVEDRQLELEDAQG